MSGSEDTQTDTFGSRLRAARTRAGLNQTDLGKQVGGTTTRQSVSAWEKDERLPRVTLLPKIAEALGVDQASLFPPPAASLSEAERIDRLEQAFRDLRAELIESGAIAPSPSDLADRLELVADEGDRQSGEQPGSSDAAQDGR